MDVRNPMGDLAEIFHHGAQVNEDLRRATCWVPLEQIFTKPYGGVSAVERLRPRLSDLIERIHST